jgi:Fic family protein
MSETKRIKDILLEFLMQQDKPLKPKEIAWITGINYNTVRARLHELKKEGKAERIKEGWVAKK